jgi:hypothetical protein
MPPVRHEFTFNIYSPSSRQFRRVVEENSTSESFDAYDSESEPELADSDDGQYSDWNGFSDKENGMSQPLTTGFSREPSPSQPEDDMNAIFEPDCAEDDAISSHQSSSSQFLDALEYQPEDGDYSEYLSDSFELPPILDPHFFDSDDDENDGDQEAAMMPRKRGRKVNSTFLLPPQGALQHPHLEWTIDEAAMNSYMPAYGKQEGFAVNLLKERGGVRRWRCIHGGKHNDYRGLPAEVTAKNRRQEVAQAGTFRGVYY